MFPRMTIGVALVGSLVFLVWTGDTRQRVGAMAPTCPDSLACVTVTSSQGGMTVVFMPGTGRRDGKCGCSESEGGEVVCKETLTCHANYDVGVDVGVGNSLWADTDCHAAGASGVAINPIAASGCGSTHSDEMKICNAGCLACGDSTIVVVGCSTSSCPGRTCQ